MYPDGNHPSDIDMFFLNDVNFLLVAEIKNELGKLGEYQKKRLERLIDGWSYNGCCLYITHDKYYQKGDKMVNVPECWDNLIYYKNSHKWVKPKKPIKVKQIIDDCRNMERMKKSSPSEEDNGNK